MAGGLMQLVAYGAQDVYLTGNPQITFWKVTYRRHTNFAMESIEQTFNGQADFGRRVQCTISRNGDLAYRTYLEVTLPEVNPSTANDIGQGTGKTGRARWLDYPGEQIVDSVEIEIGGQRIDRQYGQWMHIWNQLTMTKDQEAGYHKMIGHTTGLTYLTEPAGHELNTPCATGGGAQQTCQPRKALPMTTLYVPLQFWYCRNPGLALPLIALQYHEVKINLTFRDLDKCLFVLNAQETSAGNKTLKNNFDTKVTPKNVNLVTASLFVDYIFLDTDERRRMAQNPHEYLIEQLQHTGSESIASSSNKVKLNFNHPCKELIWTVQKDSLVDDCGPMNRYHGCQYFNYTDAVDILPNTLDAFTTDSAFGSQGKNGTTNQAPMMFGLEATDDGVISNPSPVTGSTGNGTDSLSADVVGVTSATSTTVANKFANDGRAAGFIPATSFVASEVAKDMHCWGNNPVLTAKLQLNGQDRFSEREGSYFDLVQPYQHHTSNPDTGINVYSFALRPEEHQPSGTCNFSRIDNASLNLVVTSNALTNYVDVNSVNDSAKVNVYAVNYNVLRIMSGMGGLAYSN